MASDTNDAELARRYQLVKQRVEELIGEVYPGATVDFDWSANWDEGDEAPVYATYTPLGADDWVGYGWCDLPADTPENQARWLVEQMLEG